MGGLLLRVEELVLGELELCLCVPELLLGQLVVAVGVVEPEADDEACADGDERGADTRDDDAVGGLEVGVADVCSVEEPGAMPEEQAVAGDCESEGRPAGRPQHLMFHDRHVGGPRSWMAAIRDVQSKM
ncbi:hypothetical protein [Streptomyces avidinii]